MSFFLRHMFCHTIWMRNNISHHPDRNSSGVEYGVCMEYCVMSAGGAGIQCLLSILDYWLYTHVCVYMRVFG